MSRYLQGALAAAAWLLSVTLSPAQIAPSSSWEKEIANFEAQDRAAKPPKGSVLFAGSSSIRLWRSLAADFPDFKTINRGFGGSVLADTVEFADRIIIPLEPRLIVLYAGGNDLHGGKTPEEVAADFRAFVAKIHEHLPKTHIDYISISPNPARWAEVDKVKEANALIEKQCAKTKGCTFINIFPHMLGEDGQPRPELYGPDRLHMTPEGYQLWVKMIRPHLGQPAKP